MPERIMTTWKVMFVGGGTVEVPKARGRRDAIQKAQGQGGTKQVVQVQKYRHLGNFFYHVTTWVAKNGSTTVWLLLAMLWAEPAAAQTCSQWAAQKTAEQWQQMNQVEQEVACMIAKARQELPTPAPETKRPRSRTLALVGIVTTIIGASQMLNFGEDQKQFLGRSYCVADNGDVSAGGCGSQMQTRVGAVMLASGVTLTVVGLQRVQVSPMVGPGVKGMSATMRW